MSAIFMLILSFSSSSASALFFSFIIHSHTHRLRSVAETCMSMYVMALIIFNANLCIDVRMEGQYCCYSIFAGRALHRACMLFSVWCVCVCEYVCINWMDGGSVLSYSLTHPNVCIMHVCPFIYTFQSLRTFYEREYDASASLDGNINGPLYHNRAQHIAFSNNTYI